MRIGRVEFGVWKLGFLPDSITFRDWFGFQYEKTACGCNLITISRFYLTLLSKECIGNFKNG